tara:strand:+ start:1031 stop:1390 length:360 start_codon:yes stop_codon:yes gene_type:complete
MGFLSKVGDVWSGVTKTATGVGKVFSGDFSGFSDISSGVSGLLKDKDAMGMVQATPNYKPNVDLSGYSSRSTSPGGSGRINELGDTDRISKWSKNQAVAMYYLNMINKITTQGGPRKGA